MVAPRCSMRARTSGALCAATLSNSTMSRRRSRGARPRRTHSMKRALVMARHFVLSVTQPRRRTAPTSVTLSPQFIGRASTYSSPRWTHACERPIAILAPASSRNTSRSGSMRRTQFRNAVRFRVTSGRSISLKRGRFFKHEPVAARGPMAARARRPLRPRDASVVLPAQLRHRRIRSVPHDGSQDDDINRTRSAAAFRLRQHRPRVPPSCHPPLQGPMVHTTHRGQLRVRSVPTVVRRHRPLATRHVVRIGHGAIKVHLVWQLKWDQGLGSTPATPPTGGACARSPSGGSTPGGAKRRRRVRAQSG